MKRFIYFFTSLVLIVTGASCKKGFLDNVGNKSILLRQDYVVDIKTTNEFMNGIYPVMSNSLYTGYQVIYGDLIADNLKPVIASTGNTPLYPHYSWTQQADDASTSSTSPWPATMLNCNGISYSGYALIRACNFVLEKANEYDVQDPQMASNVRGQAYAIRALTYFTLLNIFAQPYSFTPDASHPGLAIVTTSNISDPVAGRNTVKQGYDLMISDLQKAIDLLPAATVTTLKMNRNAAKALLSKIYLFKGDYTAARQMAAAVVKDVPIMTTNYPAKLFTPNETEALFQLPPGTGTNNKYTTNFANLYFRSRIQFRASSDIAKMLSESPNDLRRAWVSFVATPAPGYWNVTKYPSGATADPTTDIANAYYQTALRSSDLYLVAAECYANLGREDSALYYLNAIQRRANAVLTPSSITGKALLDSIYKERRKEMSFEGMRMFDLLRWKQGVTRSDETAPALKSLSFPNSRAIAPISKLDVTILGLEQNKDY